ncbi:TBP-associated factor 4 [Striga asiatica]|uniref:TBP-associated factor 4 n=1 Tax=Striga asiatica TaxID=4170 RepID=A0A5A7PZA3_STRAF|nr:TBP-associated factor 4 [Striga asiatica]
MRQCSCRPCGFNDGADETHFKAEISECSIELGFSASFLRRVCSCRHGEGIVQRHLKLICRERLWGLKARIIRRHKQGKDTVLQVSGFRMTDGLHISVGLKAGRDGHDDPL